MNNTYITIIIFFCFWKSLGQNCFEIRSIQPSYTFVATELIRQDEHSAFLFRGNTYQYQINKNNIFFYRLDSPRFTREIENFTVSSFRCKEYTIGKEVITETYLDGLNIKNIQFTGDSLNINMNESNFKIFQLNSKSQSTLMFNNIVGDTVYVSGQVDIKIEESKIQTLHLFNLKITNFINFGNTVPKSIFLDNVEIPEKQTIVYLENFNTSNRICLLNIRNTDLSKFKFDYTFFKISNLFDKKLSNSEIEDVYTQVMSIQKKFGFSAGYEKADKELKYFEYNKNNNFYGKIANWIDSNWWDYGYNKFLIFRGTSLIIFSFWLLNFLLFRKLLKSYPILTIMELMKNSTDRNKLYKLYIRGICSLIYTNYIFWGLKIDLNKLKLQSLSIATLIIFEFVIGIICLAYIANYVVTK